LSGCNVLYGNNAQGKTNLIEAIFCLCFTRSFRTNRDSELLRFNSPFLRVAGNFRSDQNVEQVVSFNFRNGDGKKIYLTDKRITRYSELIGRFPIVLLSPEDYLITNGAPLQRRRMIDAYLAQVNPVYLNTLQKYSRILKQRNKMLAGFAQKGTFDKNVLSSWNSNLIQYGSFLIRFRNSFISEFNPLLSEIYSNLNLSDETIRFFYKPSLPISQNRGIEESYAEELKRRFLSERVRKTTLTGPHRDDFGFEIGGNDLRTYGSRGQHKSALVALRLAQFKYLQTKTGETPILLLDDLFSDLDRKREQRILGFLQNIGQVFITTNHRVSDSHTAIPVNEWRVHDGKLDVSNG
ncbi:DNA replication and repair protein RecF, partial [bacterium]|nr:DNA replication and repair protein RecF [bacterium]